MKVIQQFIDASPEFQLKFVVSDPGDVVEINELLTKLKGWSRRGCAFDAGGDGSGRRWIPDRGGSAKSAKREGYRFCPRLHVMLYGNRRGT